MSAHATAPSPRGGPRTPEGKTRSAQNARKHGLRAREFGLAPDEDPQEWAQHLAICELDYGPLDPHEKNLVCTIAASMRNEIRADRMMAEVMVRIPPANPGHSHGTDAQEPAHALSLGTAICYQTAGMATQRTQRAFFAYRKAKLAGLIVPHPAPPEAANQNRTHEPPHGTCEPGGCGPQMQNCTNEMSPCTSEPGTAEPQQRNRTSEPGPCGRRCRRRSRPCAPGSTGWCGAAPPRHPAMRTCSPRSAA